MTAANPLRVRQFVFHALHVEPGRLTVADAVAMRSGDWDYLCHLADMHRLAPMLYERLRHKDFLDVVPGEVMTTLRDQHRWHTLHNLALYHELVEVTRLLNAAGIEAIVLKGAYLAQFVYPEVGLRPMRDLDLLVAEDKVIEAFECLTAKGYKPAYEAHLPTCLETQKHLPPLVSANGMMLEIHHRLMNPEPGRNPLLRNDLFQRSISKTISGTPIRFLCPEDLLLHLCVHATYDHELNVGPQVLADIALLAKTHDLNWNDFSYAVETGGWLRGVQPLLAIARRELGANIPEELAECEPGVQETAEFLLFSELDDHRMLPESIQQIRTSGGLRVKFKAAASRVFLSRTDMARQYAVDPRSVKVFLYYPVRWFRLITEVVPKLVKGYARDSESMDELVMHKQTYRQWLESGER